VTGGDSICFRVNRHFTCTWKYYIFVIACSVFAPKEQGTMWISPPGAEYGQKPSRVPRLDHVDATGVGSCPQHSSYSYPLIMSHINSALCSSLETADDWVLYQDVLLNCIKRNGRNSCLGLNPAPVTKWQPASTITAMRIIVFREDSDSRHGTIWVLDT
jgi:hypothetical protein